MIYRQPDKKFDLVSDYKPTGDKPEAIAWADYRVELYDKAGGAALRRDWEGLMARPSIPVVKKTKHREQELDLRPLVTQLELTEGEDSLALALRLPAGPAINLNPSLLLGALWEARGGEADYVRVLRTAILREDFTPFA